MRNHTKVSEADRRAGGRPRQPDSRAEPLDGGAGARWAPPAWRPARLGSDPGRVMPRATSPGQGGTEVWSAPAARTALRARRREPVRLWLLGPRGARTPSPKRAPSSLAPGGGPEARRAEWPSQSGFPGPKRGAVSFPVLCLRSASGAQGAPLTGSTRLALALLPSGSASAFAHVLGPLTLTVVADTSPRGLFRPWFGACSSAFARLSHSSFSFSACQAFFRSFRWL